MNNQKRSKSQDVKNIYNKSDYASTSSPKFNQTFNIRGQQITIDHNTYKTSKSKNKSLLSINSKKTNSVDLNPQHGEAKSKLNKIFEHYASFGDKLNLSALKSKNFEKFAVESKIIDENFNKTRLELIFTTETKTLNKKQMNFEMFLSALIKIAEYKYIKGSKTNSGVAIQTALNKLLKLHVFPLYDKLFEKGEIQISKFNSNFLFK
jgi:hypothetical protein